MSDGISNNKTVIACTGILGIVILDAIALMNGVNGVVMASSIGAISAIVAGTLGFVIGLKKN